MMRQIWSDHNLVQPGDRVGDPLESEDRAFAWWHHAGSLIWEAHPTSASANVPTETDLTSTVCIVRKARDVACGTQR